MNKTYSTEPGINGKLECKRTRNRIYDGLDNVELSRSVTEIRRGTLPLIEEYELSVQHGVRFHANSAQSQRAREDAEILLREHIYGDIQRELYELRMRLHAGQREEAFASTNRIMDIIRGKV